MIVDSHAHYDSEAFDADREQVLGTFLPAHEVGLVINCASDFASSEFSLQLSERYDYIYAAVGVHPHEAEAAGVFNKECLTALAAHKKCVAIGEIGLDYHYDFSPRETQKEWFEKQLQLANELDLPVIIHDREAHADTMTLLQAYKPRGVVHCFSGSVEMARQVLELGMYIGLGGAVTFKNAKTPVEVAEFVPADRLLLETDCPYMTPVPYRGQRNDSSLIAVTAGVIAGYRGISVPELLQTAEANTRRLFFG